MRFVVKPEEHKTDKLKSPETYVALLDIAKNKKKSKITGDIYREPYQDKYETRSRMEDHLALSYFNKCAYCERKTKADIEHYRPKKGVAEDSTHDGYYWLCYEWTNLLPACVKCNRDGGKHNMFPIIGSRVYAPRFIGDVLDLDQCKAVNDPLVQEVPYLLHPEVDRGEDYFEFEWDEDGDGIRIKEKSTVTNDRGAKTIEICSLNRQELRQERVENVVVPFITAVECVFVDWEDGGIDDNGLFDQLKFQIGVLQRNASIEKYTHTLLRRYILFSEENFKEIVLTLLEESIRALALEAYRSIIGN